MISNGYTPSQSDLGDDSNDDYYMTVEHVQDNYGLIGHAYFETVCDESSGVHSTHPPQNPASIILEDVPILKGLNYRICVRGEAVSHVIQKEVDLETTVYFGGSATADASLTRNDTRYCSLLTEAYSLSTRAFIINAAEDTTIKVVGNFNHVGSSFFSVSDGLIDVQAVGNVPAAELGTSSIVYTAMP